MKAKQKRRNYLVPLIMNLKAGVHDKTNKAKRKKEKQSFAKQDYDYYLNIFI